MDKGLRTKECFVILLATIIITTIARVVSRAFPFDESITESLGYTIGMSLSALYAIRIYQKHSEEFTVDISPVYLKFIPLVIIWPILMVFGITSHLIYLIPTPESLNGVFDEAKNSNGWLSILTVAFIAPILEEVIFRGVILKGLLSRYNPIRAILISSILFGLVHLNPWQFVGAFGIGVISGWLFWKTNNLILPIVMHISNNLFFGLFGMYYGTEYLIDTPMQEVFGSPINQSIATTVAIVLFGVIWYTLSRAIKLDELKNTTYNSKFSS